MARTDALATSIFLSIGKRKAVILFSSKPAGISPGLLWCARDRKSPALRMFRDMAEFFIIRGRRRLGVGMKAAQAIWRRFPGKWEVRVRDRNRGAKEFWAGTVAAFIGKKIHPIAFEKNGELWHVFSFESD